MTDTLTNENGVEVKLDALTAGNYPPKDLEEDPGYQAPVEDGEMEKLQLLDSKRLQLLTRFEPWLGSIYRKLLIKAKGKCTTDHISMAGPWLTYRGAS